jgi:trimeric autotransporter adhesin
MIKDRSFSAVPYRYRNCFRHLLLLAIGLWPAILLAQPYTPVTLSGFTADVIADGPSLASSVTADVDGTGYYFLNGTFTQLGTPTFYLPNSGLINSAATPGLTYQLASASGPNSLRLPVTAPSGTLTLATPRIATTLYLLVTSGSGNATADITVTFTDGSTQVFTGQAIADWYTGTNIAIQGIGRTSATSREGSATTPRLYQLALPISAANQSKPIASFSLTRLTGGIIHVMGATVSIPCTTPSAQPTALAFSGATPSSVNGTFGAAVPAADQYPAA